MVPQELQYAIIFLESSVLLAKLILEMFKCPKL